MDDDSPRQLQSVVNQIGLGRFQGSLMALCGATYMADAMEIMLISYVGIPEVCITFNSTPSTTLVPP